MEEETISLKEIVQIIKKRILMIISITFCAVFLSGLATYFMITPIYKADSQFLVSQNQSETTVELNDIRTNIELISTYSEIIRSNRILDEVIDDLNITIGSNALRNKITVSNAGNSQVVTISVTDPDPKIAVDLANTTVEVFQNRIDSLMNVNNVNVLNEAVLPEDPTPISPNLFMNLVIAFVLGGMIGVGLAFLLDYLDTTIKTEEEVEQTLKLPVMGVIPSLENTDIMISRERQLSRTGRERRTYDGKEKKRV